MKKYVKMKKAISPLIASVLLIAFTLVIGIFLSSWFQDVAKTQTEAAISGSRTECTFVRLVITNANFTNRNNSVNGNYTLTFNVENAGGQTTNIIGVQIIYADGTTTDGIFYINKSGTAHNIGNVTLIANAIKAIMVNNTDNTKILRIRAISDCPGKYAETSTISNNPS